MSLDSITLRISTPTEPLAPGRGFYQLEEDILFVQIGKFSSKHRFYSYIESDNLRLDIDKSGHLIFLEYRIPRRQWTVDENLLAPTALQSTDIRWIDFREKVKDPVVTTNKKRTKVCFSFSNANPDYSFLLAESVFLQVDKDKQLVAIWIDDITDDIAGREIAAFRKKVRGKESFFEKPATLK